MRKKFRGGFTLIELSLSLIFIALLSLAVVFLIQNLTASYRRGLILNQVNTVGMDLIDDFRISIQNANSESITKLCKRRYGDNESTGETKECIDDNAASFVSTTRYASVNGVSGSMPVYGAFCTGTYTYVWNTGYFEKGAISNVSPAVIGTQTSVTSGVNVRVKDFRLVKIYDSARSICVNAMMAQNGWNSSDYVKKSSLNVNTVENKFVIDEEMYSRALALDGGAIDLFKKDTKNSDLVIYELYVASPALSITRQNMYYAASFILGTMRGGININATGNNCKPPNDNNTEIDYCAINKFNFGVTAGGY